ncbi:MAG: hypothetical protein JNJ92_03160 [Altererythrobacter sp.]|nr:hypothetical protein [Altererythrobacter sp.]
MKLPYVIAVTATRLLGLAMILILFHLMPGDEFGTFSLINTNAMLVYMALGAWVIAIANRSLVTDSGVVDQAMLSAVGIALLGVVAAVLAVGVAMQLALSLPGNAILMTVALAAVLIIYEATLASKNALGRANAYAVIAVARNVLALLLAVGLVAAGEGVTGAIVGIGAGALLAIFAQPLGRRLWAGVRYRPGVFAPLKPYLLFGIGGALQLGCYILVNAPLRNLIALKFGAAAAGLWSVTTDLYYGPLALIANAYALSQVRLIYLAAAQGDEQTLRARCRALLEFSAVLAALYVAGSAFFAVDAVSLVVPSASTVGAEALAFPSALFGTAIMVLYCIVTVAISNNHVGLVAIMISSAALVSALPALWSRDVLTMCWQASLGVSVLVLAWSLFTVFRYRLYIGIGQMARLGCAVVSFVAVAAAGLHLLRFDFAWLASAAAATAVFLATALLLRVDGLVHVLPPALRDR